IFGAKLSEGVFIVSFLSMSSTVVDCTVGLLFVLLPVLGGSRTLMLSLYLTATPVLSWSFVPCFLKLMMQLSSQCSDNLGLGLELGLFMVAIMVSTKDFAQYTLDQVELIRNLFAAIFLWSIGMLIHVQFLWNHVDILLAIIFTSTKK
ncbi:hypothetical protein HN51_027613, partial [Arachis hypogaea]